MSNQKGAGNHEYQSDLSYEEQFAAITGRTLDARTIDSYADEALDSLVALVESALAAYSDDAIIHMPKAERERHVLIEAGLDPDIIETTLDHIAKIADSIKQLDTLIAKRTEHTDVVLVPPDQQEVDIQPGEGAEEWLKEIVPKLKVLLLLLKEEFNIDIESDDVHVTSGILDASMMRSHSYNMVEIIPLERLVLVCDESGNTTFVFDTKRCAQYGIPTEEIANLSKSLLKQLLQEAPELGQKIDYSREYVNQLAIALAKKNNDGTPEEPVRNVELLTPKVDTIADGYLPRKGLTEKFDLSHDTIQKAIDDLGSQLGNIIKARVNHQIANVYSPEQQEIIRSWLDDRGHFLDAVAEGHLSVKGIARSLGIGEITVNRAIDALGSQLSEATQARIRGRVTTVYSPEQKNMIERYLIEQGLLASVAPQGYLSIRGLAKKLGVAEATVRRATIELDEQLGEVIQARMGVRTTAAYSLEQQASIQDYLDERGTLVPIASEGQLSAKGLADKLGVVRQTVQNAIENLDSQLGEVVQVRFGTKITTAYSLEQQAMIQDWLQTHSKAKFD
jgi:biotin operon repressor